MKRLGGIGDEQVAWIRFKHLVRPDSHGEGWDMDLFVASLTKWLHNEVWQSRPTQFV